MSTKAKKSDGTITFGRPGINNEPLNLAKYGKTIKKLLEVDEKSKKPSK